MTASGLTCLPSLLRSSPTKSIRPPDHSRSLNFPLHCPNPLKTLISDRFPRQLCPDCTNHLLVHWPGRLSQLTGKSKKSEPSRLFPKLSPPKRSSLHHIQHPGPMLSLGWCDLRSAETLYSLLLHHPFNSCNQLSLFIWF
jgi:hypothetical protein